MDSLSDAKILVTGADGFIGSHLVEELLRQGRDVRAFVMYNSFNTWGWLETLEPRFKKDLDLFAGDIRDPYGVKEAMRGCDIVLHLAALVAIPYSYHSPETYVDTNIRGTLNVLQAARELGVQKVVHTSTSEVYGTALFVPMTEDHPLQGQSPYSASKIGADQMALAFHRSFELPVTIVRPFNTYGPRQSARAVIPAIIAQIASGAEKVRLGAASPTRDFNYVADTVSGFLAAAAAKEAVGEVINLGSGFEFSIGETVEIIAELMQVSIEVETEQERLRPAKSEVERLLADNGKAAYLLGWRPAYAGPEGFRRGLSETIDWFRLPENLQVYKADRYNV